MLACFFCFFLESVLLFTITVTIIMTITNTITITITNTNTNTSTNTNTNTNTNTYTYTKTITITITLLLLLLLEGTAPYAGLLPAPADGFGQGVCWSFWKKIFLFVFFFWLILGNFSCSVVTSVTFSKKKMVKKLIFFSNI